MSAIPNQIAGTLKSTFSLLSGGCVAWPCASQEIPEEAQLMEGDRGSEIGDAPEFDDIRLLSYNIFIRCFLGPPAPKFTHNVENDFKDQRLRCFIDHYLDRYDVICLQEMFGAFSRRRRRLIKAARKKGFFWKVSSPQSRSSMYLVDGGCLILSRLKIVAEAHMIFEPGMMSDRLAAKGVIYAKLHPKPGVYVHLFVTHMQAVYAGSDTIKECLSIQKHQYAELVEFVASTVAANETSADMVEAQRLRDKKRRREMGVESSKSSSTRGSFTPPEQDSMFVSRKCRRWPILIAGDFNCNSRPATGDVATQVTKPYADLISSLSKIGSFSDVLYDRLGEHPVTYAAADFALHGSFSPRETALTSPEDYHESGEFVNQSLDYVFLFPPTHEELNKKPLQMAPVADGEMSPDSRYLRTSILKPTQAGVDHLKFILPTHRQTPYGSLKYVSDHFAVETSFTVTDQSN